MIQYCNKFNLKGTHSNGPSQLVESKQSLSEYLKEKGDSAIGSKISAHFYTQENNLQSGDLPFLFKVLSINQALSIQAHPNKTLAKQLHQRDPKNYPDSNHKPEMLIAISETFEAMCGFRLSNELVDHFNNYSELTALCDLQNVKNFIESTKQNDTNLSQLLLRNCFSSMMSSSDEFLCEQFNKLKTRLEELPTLKYLDDLFLKLAKQYPNDVGCFSVYLLNCIKLKKGEAIFLSANVPHAYLFGDGVECMACSDNVVRAGLTPKFKDVNVLCEMLDYSMRSIEDTKLGFTKLNEFMIDYKPSVDEFSVQQIKITNNNLRDTNKFLIPKNESGSILIIVENGSSESYFEASNGVKINNLRDGLVYFIDSFQEVYFNAVKSDSNETVLLAYRAYCDIKS